MNAAHNRLWAVLLVLLLVGCSGNPTRTVTLEDSMRETANLVTITNRQIEDELNLDKITVEKAMEYRETTREVSDTLKTAADLLLTDRAEARSKYGEADRMLNNLRGKLR